MTRTLGLKKGGIEIMTDVMVLNSLYKYGIGYFKNRSK